MPADLSTLTTDFRADVTELLGRLAQEGHQLVPFYALRDPWQQARLWRQSRSRARIVREVARLREHGAEWLATEVLWAVGPTVGRWATNALPGQSWHQWGEAVDCYVLADVDRDGDVDDACWDADHPGYIRYAQIAEDMGLTAGRSFRDSVHVQRTAGKVLHHFDWPAIDRQMRERFGERPA